MCHQNEKFCKKRVLNITIALLFLRCFFKLIREETLNMSTSTGFASDLEKKADENFAKIKESVKGIYEIFKITLNDNDSLFKMGLDNVIGIYQNFLELMLNDYGAKQFMKKLRSSEVEIDIPLDFFLDCEEETEEEETEGPASY